MHAKCKHFLIAIAMACVLTFDGSFLQADSLVTTDGEMLMGSITKTSAGYTVQTTDGTVNIAADKVKKVLYDHPPVASVASPTTPVAQAASTTAVKDPRMVQSLLAQGEVAYANGELTDARDAFDDVLALDAKNSRAARGLGYTYIKMRDPAKAARPLEVAALTANPVDRTLTMTLSASLVASHNAMRAVKYVRAYLDANPTPPDEAMLNALAIALSQVDHSAIKGDLFTGASKLYTKLNEELEATLPGKKRWGIDWLSADDVDEKKKARAAAQAKVDDALVRLQSANSKVQAARNTLSSAQASTANHNIRDAKIREAQDRLSSAIDKQQTAQSAYDDANSALADVPAPSLPEEVPLDTLDLSLVPKPVVAANIANPTPMVTDAAPAADSAPQAPAAPAPAVEAEEPDKHATRYAVAFAIAPNVLVTAASAVEDATSIQVTTGDGKNFKAEILRTHHGDGLALLKIAGGKFPCLMLASSVPPGATGSLTCLGYPDVDLFNPVAKKMNATSAGQTDSWTVRFDASPRLPGGPLMENNAVVGVELGDRDSDLAQVPAANLKALLSLVRDSANAPEPVQDPTLAIVQVAADR